MDNPSIGPKLHDLRPCPSMLQLKIAQQRLFKSAIENPATLENFEIYGHQNQGLISVAFESIR